MRGIAVKDLSPLSGKHLSDVIHLLVEVIIPVNSSENDEDESQSPRKRRVLNAVSLPANSTTTDFVGGVCDIRHFPRNYDIFLSNLKPGDVITVRMKSKDPHRRFSNDKARKRRAVVLQLKKDVDCLRYVKVSDLSHFYLPSLYHSFSVR